MLAPRTGPGEQRGSDRDATITCTSTEEETTITVLGHLEWDTAGELAAALEDTETAATVVVDLRGLVWADSAVLHALINTQRRLRRRDAALILRGPLQPVPQRLFDLTGTLDYFSYQHGEPGA